MKEVSKFKLVVALIVAISFLSVLLYMLYKNLATEPLEFLLILLGVVAFIATFIWSIVTIIEYADKKRLQ